MNRRKARLTGAAALVAMALTALALAGCQGSNTRDLEGVKARDPQKAELYVNVDGHPNVVRLCIDGLAFATTTREHDGLHRVAEWDPWCKG